MTESAESARVLQPFAFRIQPHLYAEIAGWYAKNAELFKITNKAYRALEDAPDSLQQQLREDALLKPCRDVLSTFMDLTGMSLKGQDKQFDLRKVRVNALGALCDYGRFFREVKAQIGCAGKPLNERVRNDLLMFMKEYETMIRPAVVIGRYKCRFSEDRIEIDELGEPIISRNLHRFYTTRLKQKADQEYATYEKANSEFAPPEECFLFAATIGPDLDKEVHRLTDEGETYKALMLNGIGAGAADMVAYDLEHFINDKHAVEGARWRRFHVGYGDFDLKEQVRLFDLIKPSRINIQLTPTCLMIPEKSVSGIMALKRYAIK